ncbi:MAG: general secretion pathway protein J [Desulfobacteraceae bacterium Eth-SRB2]|nr:MAG: general secretion pathway protein J [Desulfobacteraceae bacterium Eth-SRB2]
MMSFTTIFAKHRVQIFLKPSAIHQNNGFTLLELLMSLSILSIIVVIIFGALRIGVRAWEKGEKQVDAHQRQRIVLDLMKQQLSSIRLKKIKNEGQASFFLKGDSKSLEFVSGVSMIPRNTFETVYVKYQVKNEERNAERLFFFEKNLVLIERDHDLAELDDQAFHELIPEVQSVAFEYLKVLGQAGNHEWQPRWEPDTDVGVPLAVKIVLKENVKTAPITVMVRLVPEEDT